MIIVLSSSEHVYRILKPGGEMYFSDVYASQRVPILARFDPEIYVRMRKEY
jgi:hypothetical protein